jgi:phosphoribosylformylglycinamidine synthase
VIGIVGILDDVNKAVPSAFQRAGDKILLIGEGLGAEIAPIAATELGSSEFAKTILGQVWGEPPYLWLEGEHELHRCLIKLSEERLISSASDVGSGGIAVALVRAAVPNGLGVKAELLPLADASLVHTFFGEPGGIVMVTCSPELTEKVKDIAFSFDNVNVLEIGKVAVDSIRITTAPDIAVNDDGGFIELSVMEAKNAFAGALEAQLAEEVLA